MKKMYKNVKKNFWLFLIQNILCKYSQFLFNFTLIFGKLPTIASYPVT